ncbi:MAG TPA: DUF1844 domain-containing protein [Candidatus Acidoferrales bacterium]|nr:DUF1844 domain-containing protein [Candidatus Acidoferrales bacterium]
MSQSKHEETFKVIDRRMFTSEGELRPEAVEQEKSAPIAPAEPAPKSPQNPGATSAPTAPAATGKPQQATAAVGTETPAASIAFQKLVDFLAQNAVVCLGVPDPRTGQAFIDLETARELIDMLEALHEKTRGNLAPDDDRLLAEVLGQLQLTFLDRSQAVAKARREKQPGSS